MEIQGVHSLFFIVSPQPVVALEVEGGAACPHSQEMEELGLSPLPRTL